MRKCLPLLAVALLAGCGSKEPRTTPVQPTQPHAPVSCNPPLGTGTLGSCVPKRTSKVAAPRITGTLVPDVSEYNGCRLYSEAIIRVYEAGLGLTDTKARCHIAEAHRLHVWAATYAFTRPGHGGCRYQADRAVSITNQLGGVSGPVIDDAEVPESRGEVACFLAEVVKGGYPAVEYTCPGCEDPQIHPVWIAAYPFRPAGTWVAHQFSSEWNCRGVPGDCSIDEGILHILRAPPIDRRALEARQRVLRFVLLRYGCRHRKAHHEALGPRCRRWFREGDRIARELR